MLVIPHMYHQQDVYSRRILLCLSALQYHAFLLVIFLIKAAGRKEGRWRSVKKESFPQKFFSRKSPGKIIVHQGLGQWVPTPLDFCTIFVGKAVYLPCKEELPWLHTPAGGCERCPEGRSYLPPQHHNSSFRSETDVACRALQNRNNICHHGNKGSGVH